jgi:tetratricopeptide (TPR) repeat protein
MSQHFISFEDARHDLLTASAYLAERIKSGDGHAQAMSAIVPRYLAAGNVDLAAELSNTVDDPFTRDKLLTEVAEKCAEIDDDEYALQLADAVEEFGLRSQALERVALQKVHKGQIDKSVEIADSMAHPDYVYASASVFLANDGKKDAAADMLGRVGFPSAKVSALQAMAMSELAAGNKDESVALLDRARETAGEIEHNEERIRTLCELGNHYVEARRNDLAIGAYEAAKEEAEQLDNIHRDAFIGAAVMGFLHAGSTDTADRTLDLVTDKTQMSNCLLAFAKHYWEKSEKEDALDALDEAYQILRSQRDIETRDSRARFGLFGSIAAQFAGFEKGERGIEIAQEIDEPNQRTAALSQIAAILTLEHNDEEARHAVNAIEEDSDRAFALIGMSDIKQKNGDHPAAVKLLEEAAHMVEEVPQLTSRSSAYNEITRRFVENGEKAKAAEMSRLSFNTLSAIRDESSRAIALANLSDILGDPELEIDPIDEESISNILRSAG